MVKVSKDSFDITKNTSEGDYSQAKYSDPDSTNESAIRVLSLMVGGGVVAVNACIAVLLTFSEANAIMSGSF